MSAEKVYPPQDPIQLDRDGNYYCRHVSAMTAEGLHDKSEIAEQLAWRDREMDRQAAEIVRLRGEVGSAKSLLDRACPHLLDEGQEYEDDGSNEPLELAREIEQFTVALPSDESALVSASLAFDGGKAATIAPAEAKGDGLWCLHVLGPDEVHAAPSKAHAEQAVAIFNATFPRGEGEVRVEAVVAPWPHSEKSHAESVAEFIPNWLLPRWQVEALTKLTPQPAGGQS